MRVAARRQAAAGRVQRAIGRVLAEDWDPIGVGDVPQAQDEYDGYVSGVYRLLAAGASPRTVAEHLCSIEADRMGFKRVAADARLSVANKLCSLSETLEPE